MQAKSTQRTYRVTGRTLENQQGAILVLYVLMLPVLLGLAALAIDVASWNAVKAELSKSVDAAAIAGAASIASDKATTLAVDFGKENFPSGLLGTKVSATFNATLADHTISVTGSVSAPAYLARILGINQVAFTNAGAAKKNKVEIMLVLDRSGSMAGTPMKDLQTAAKSFVSFFTDTQAEDKMGLISFATGVTINFSLGNNYVTAMTTAIGNMSANGGTNAEDALAAAEGPSGLPDQSGLAVDTRVQQFLLFFSDGNPTAFRGKFKYNGTDYDAVALGTGNNCDAAYTYMGYPGYPDTVSYYSTSTLSPTPTGDGNRTSGSPLTACTNNGRYLNAYWYVFSDSKYGIAGSPTQCRRTTSDLSFLPAYICNTAEQMAIDHAQELKNKFVKIYSIGLGSTIDKTFLSQIASGATYAYYAPTSSQLQAIFQTIAKDIKLRLVE